jgi:hypothetical protein
MERRAYAEECRLKYFNYIINSKINKKGSNSEEVQLLHRLEYFRRYQLDMQTTYYTALTNKNDIKANKLLTYTALCMGGVTLINGLAGSFGVGNAQWTSIAALAIVLQSLASILTNKEAVEQNQTNAERYARTSKNLLQLQSNLDEVRVGILEGNKTLIQSFVAAVHEPLAAEHRQWLEGQSEAETAIGQLEEVLREHRKKAPQEKLLLTSD